MSDANTCPAREEWRRWLAGELPAADRQRLDQHAEHCSGCQGALEGLGAGSWAAQARQLGGGESTIGPALQQAVRAALRCGAEPLSRPALGQDVLAHLQPPDRPEHLGRLGHYAILEVIGQGGMGVVFKAFDEAVHRVVAIKQLFAQFAAHGSSRQRFLREARAAGAVSHEHVVALHAVEENHGTPFLVLQYIPGPSLQQKLDRTGPLELKEILRIGTQIAEGLAAAHKQGLVHRDIKPSNILLENGIEKVKITDFGLARALDDASLTVSGTVAGTPQYMSPEQADGKSVDHRSDLFSLGSVLYALCTGRPPYQGSAPLAVLRRVCDECPEPIDQINPDIPDWLCEIVARLHAKDPDARFQSAQEVALLLGQHLAHVQQPRQVPPPPRLSPAGRGAQARRGKGLRRRWRPAVLAVSVLALGLVLATSLGWFGGEHLPRSQAPADDQAALGRAKGPGAEQDWKKLFNGKDLSGWNQVVKFPGGWTVEDGILVGRGEAIYLVSDRGTYANFHLRLEAIVGGPATRGLFFRAGAALNQRGRPTGYAAQIEESEWSPCRTGSLRGLVERKTLSYKPGNWFTLEVIARGNKCLIKVNEETTAEYADLDPQKRRGHFILQQHDTREIRPAVMEEPSEIRVRKMEIRELPD